jgi:hypothetical protein
MYSMNELNGRLDTWKLKKISGLKHREKKLKIETLNDRVHIEKIQYV